jgi:ATP phosphoribosyltransferase regulatory subunit
MLGVRADMTPQAARIDAHAHRREAPTRLCYMGTVLRTRPDGFAGSRSPLQMGAELFGHDGIESDVEILSLVLESFGLMQVSDVHVDLGHVGIYRSLAAEAGLDERQEVALFDALQRKAATDISEILDASGASEQQRGRLAVLAELNGGQEILEVARARLAGAGEAVMAALDNLSAIATAMQQRAGTTRLFFDLAELRGYRFHTGMVFAVFVPGRGQEIARGGRYDAIGKVFGRARAATGFSMDLKTLMDLSPRDPGTTAGTILAPAADDPELLAAVSQLRAAGERVVCELPGQKGDAAVQGCERVLKKQNGSWIVESV